MDPLLWAIIGGLAVIALLAALYILNRSWGNFPRDARYQPPSGMAAPGASSPAMPVPPPLATEPASELVPIQHPLVRRSAERALARGGPPARYIVQQGNDLFFDFSQIADPAKRQQAYELMQRFNSGGNIDLRATMTLIRELFGT